MRMASQLFSSSPFMALLPAVPCILLLLPCLCLPSLKIERDATESNASDLLCVNQLHHHHWTNARSEASLPRGRGHTRNSREEEEEEVGGKIEELHRSSLDDDQVDDKKVG